MWARVSWAIIAFRSSVSRWIVRKQSLAGTTSSHELYCAQRAIRRSCKITSRCENATCKQLPAVCTVTIPACVRCVVICERTTCLTSLLTSRMCHVKENKIIGEARGFRKAMLIGVTNEGAEGNISPWKSKCKNGPTPLRSYFDFGIFFIFSKLLIFCVFRSIFR